MGRGPAPMVPRAQQDNRRGRHRDSARRGGYIDEEDEEDEEDGFERSTRRWSPPRRGFNQGSIGAAHAGGGSLSMAPSAPPPRRHGGDVSMTERRLVEMNLRSEYDPALEAGQRAPLPRQAGRRPRETRPPPPRASGAAASGRAAAAAAKPPTSTPAQAPERPLLSTDDNYFVASADVLDRLVADMRKFLTTPLPPGIGVVQCQIERSRQSYAKRMNPEYHVYLVQVRSARDMPPPTRC